jgi:moderate conductance mechanosensitive channel
MDVARPMLHILLIWVLALLLLRFLHKLVGLMKTRLLTRGRRSHDMRRLDTLSNVFHHAANVVLVAVAGMLTLGEIGISITPILATAGVAGIAIGFGAQSLVKDFFAGLFLLLENQVNEGDLIEAAGKSGTVEEVTLRHIRMRDADGSLHFIPNGIITTVTNRSREFAYAIVEVGVPRAIPLAQVFEKLNAIVEALRADPSFGADILGDADIEGVEKLEDTAVTVRLRVRTAPLQQARVRRAILGRIKDWLDGMHKEP